MICCRIASPPPRTIGEVLEDGFLDHGSFLYQVINAIRFRNLLASIAARNVLKAKLFRHQYCEVQAKPIKIVHVVLDFFNADRKVEMMDHSLAFPINAVDPILEILELPRLKSSLCW